MSRPRTLRRAAEAWPHLTQAMQEGLAAPDAEAALAAVTARAVSLLGDRQAHKRPGGLKEGEKQYQVAAAVVLLPGGKEQLFLAQQNFPAEQRHMRISAEIGHPGRVVREQKPVLLGNTDEHGDFKQILKTSRMGSAMYAPMFWQGRMFGMLICAGQARHTMRPVDFQVLQALALLGSLLWGAHKGADYLAALKG